MATFITLGKWTQKGIENVKDSPGRLESFKRAIQSMGGTLRAFYLVTGQYDMVIITEAPDAETVAKVVLATGSKGFVTTETFRAFTEDEYKKIIAGLP